MTSNTQPLQKDFPVVDFIEDTPAYFTRMGDVCVTMRARGIEPGCKSVEQLEAVCDGVRYALSLLDPSYRLYQTLFNTPLTPSDLDWPGSHPDPVIDESTRKRRDTVNARRLYRKDLYYTVLLDASTARVLAKTYYVDWLVDKLMGRENARVEELLQKADAFRSQLESSGVVLDAPDREETKWFLNRFVAFRPHNMRRAIPQDEALDYWIPNATAYRYPEYVRHDGNYLQGVHVRDLPRFPDLASNPDPNKQIHGTFAGCFNGQLDIDCGYIAGVEWHRVPDGPMATRLTNIQKNWDSKITSLSARYTAGKNDSRSDLRQDGAALGRRDELGHAQFSLANEPWGEYSCSVVLHAPTLAQVEEAMPSLFSAFKGATVFQESQAVYDLWTNQIPGNWRRNVRHLYAPTRAGIDTFHLYADNQGESRNDFFPGGRVFALLETEHRGLHYLAPNDGEVFAVHIYGEQGAGKTFLANHIAENVARQWVQLDGVWHRPKMLILDIKDSYRENTLRNGGRYLRLSLSDPELAANPWSLPRTVNNVEIVTRLIKLLIAGEDGKVCDPTESATITAEVESKYLQKEFGGLKAARLRHVHLGGTLQRRLEPWIGDGPYAKFFDNDRDDLADHSIDWLTIQLTGFGVGAGGKPSPILQALLYWHWERFMALVHDPALTLVPKFVLLDEAHEQMMTNPDIAARMLHSMNTGRAYNLWNAFVMQWAHLLYQHPLGPAMIAASPVKFFCASRSIDSQVYADIFEMPLHVAKQIKELIPARNFLRWSAAGAQKLSLVLDEETTAIYANDVRHNAARYARLA